MRGAASPAGTGASEQTTEARKRQRRRGPKGEHPAKRKHRGRRGGKHAKEAREKRLAVPLDPQTLDGIQSLATTLAEISAAYPQIDFELVDDKPRRQRPPQREERRRRQCDSSAAKAACALAYMLA